MDEKNIHKVGLIIVATNKYYEFVPELLIGADLFFLGKHDVTYFILCDTVEELTITPRPMGVNPFTEAYDPDSGFGRLPKPEDHMDEDGNYYSIDPTPYRNVVQVPHAHRKWPEATLERYHGIWENRKIFNDQDYLFLCDADMKIVNEVGNEILSDNVATIHPGHYGGRGAPETRPESLACIRPEEELVYVCGGFSGGSRETFLKKSQTISTNIDIDRKNGIMALWYDESHVNRWYLDNPPTQLLDPGYCYQESLKRPHLARIIALDKDHTEYAPERKLSDTGWI